MVRRLRSSAVCMRTNLWYSERSKFQDQVRSIGKRHYYLRGHEQNKEGKEESKELRWCHCVKEHSTVRPTQKALYSPSYFAARRAFNFFFRVLVKVRVVVIHSIFSILRSSSFFTLSLFLIFSCLSLSICLSSLSHFLPDFLLFSSVFRPLCFFLFLFFLSISRSLFLSVCVSILSFFLSLLLSLTVKVKRLPQRHKMKTS